jgi:L-asparaginase
MNDWIHAAHSLTKTSTTAVQTFMSPLRGLAGVSSYGKNDFYGAPVWKHTTASEFDVSGVNVLPRVDIIYAYVDMPADAIDSAVRNGAKGIVIAGVGDGNMTTPALDAVKRALGKGVVVVRSTRVGEGIVRRNIEVNDDQMGTVVAKELNPSKARVLLKLGLTQTSDPKRMQQFFDQF